MLLRRKTASRPSLLAVRALWLVLREKKHRVAISGTGKLALTLFICAVAAELVHGLEKKSSVKILRELVLTKPALLSIPWEQSSSR